MYAVLPVLLRKILDSLRLRSANRSRSRGWS